MDCTAPLSIETLIGRAVFLQPGRLCGTVAIGGKEIGVTSDFDCQVAEKSWTELIYGALFEGDSGIAVDMLESDDSAIKRIDDCGPLGLETLFRSALIVGSLGNKVKVVRVPGSDAHCSDCSDEMGTVPVLTRILGTFVRVGSEVRIRVQGTGLFPDANNLLCEQVGVNAHTMLASSISYDSVSETWYWNTVEI